MLSSKAILRIFIIFIASVLISQAFSQPEPIILLPGQSSRISLLPYVQTIGASFSLEDAPNYASLSYPLPSVNTVNITGIPGNYVAAGLTNNQIAVLDQSMTLHYGSYQSNSTNITLASVIVPVQKNFTSFSITFLNASILIICDDGKRSDTIYSFHTVKKSFKNTSFQHYFESAQVTTYKGGSNFFLTAYHQGGNFVCTFEYYSQKSICDILNLKGFVPEIAVVEMGFQNVLIFDQNGLVFAYQNKMINPLVQDSHYEVAGDYGDPFLGSCKYEESFINPSIAAFSNSMVYFSNSTISQSYVIPKIFNPTACVVDPEYIFLVQESQDNTVEILVFQVTTSASQHILSQYDIPLSSGQFLAVSNGQAPGQMLILFSSQLLVLSVSSPWLELHPVQGSESSLFNVVTQGSQTSIPINVTVISNLSQIYQKPSTMDSLYLFGPTIDLQKYFTGPGLGVKLGSNGAFFGGVYGPCQTDFGVLNLSSYNHLYVKYRVPADDSDKTSLSATIISLYQDTLLYTDITFRSAYSPNLSQSCIPSAQVVSKNTVNLMSQPLKCIFGQTSDFCIFLSSIIVNITSHKPNFFYLAGCKGFTLYTIPIGDSDAVMCIGWNSFAIAFGNTSLSITTEEIGVEYFSTVFAASYHQEASKLTLVYLTGLSELTGIHLFKSEFNITYSKVFQIQVSYSNNVYLQIVNDRLILADLGQNTITEWDISNPFEPALTGNYPLFSFTLNPNVAPVYHPAPNHLVFSASSGSVPYYLVFQPGNAATSVLLYAINLGEAFGSRNQVISSFYDPINQYTVLFSLNNTFNYYYALSSPVVPFQELAQLELQGQTDCLYCSGNISLQITSTVIQDSVHSATIPYVMISPEQPPRSQDSSLEFSITYQEPLTIWPNDVFQGTVLDYSLTELTIDNQSVLFMKKPINPSQSYEIAGYLPVEPSPVSLFNDGTVLYIVGASSLWSVNISEPQMQIQNVSLPNIFHPPQNRDFYLITGSFDSSSGTKVLAFWNQSTWGIYTINYCSENIPDQIIKVKVLGTHIFVLTKAAFELIYVFMPNNYNYCVFSYFINSPVSLINPLDFSVENLFQNMYAILVVDGSDTLYGFIYYFLSHQAQSKILSNFTQKVIADLPQEGLQIIGVQSVNVTSQGGKYIIDYVLYVRNFHSYQVQITFGFGQDIQIGNIVKCFVQMPGYISLGNAFTTDSYFLDLKQIGNSYYLFSYPLNLAYSSNGGQSGNYSYVKPIQRQVMNSSSISIFALNGEDGILFVAENIPINESNQTQNISLQVYDLKSSLEIGFNSTFTEDDLSKLDENTVNLIVANDMGNASIVVSLVKGFPTYAIVLISVFGLALLGLCVWLFIRYYKKRKVALVPKEEVYENLRDVSDA